MWANIKVKSKEILAKVQAIKPPAINKPDFSGMGGKLKTGLSAAVSALEPKHLVYFALIIMPAIVGLGAYYGIMDSKAKLEATKLPENQLFRQGVNFTADDFVKYAGRGEKGITTLFIQAGMPPDTYRKNDGFTPLHAAAAYGKPAIARLLLDQGADVNARDKAGQTALMKAVWNSHADVVNVLLQRGAAITDKDSNGNTVIGMAKTKNDRRVLSVLVEAGVKELKEDLDKVSSAPARKPDRVSSTPDSKTPPKVNASGDSTAVKPTAAVQTPAGKFILTAGYAGNIGIGKSAETVYQEFGEQAVVVGDGYLGGRMYPVLKAYNQATGALSLIVFYAKGKENEKIVTAIHVLDERYKTGNGIGIGGTLGELRRSSAISSIQYSDALYAVSRDGKIRYELDISAESIPAEWLNGGGDSSLPDAMKIRSIFVF